MNPEFLAALPPNIQEEVLAQQRLEQQRRSAAQVFFCPRNLFCSQNRFCPKNLFLPKKSLLTPNFLLTTILIQVDPTAPVDPGEFLQTLPPSLRQSLLADMEESQISALPAELAAEAQNLRRDYEQVNIGLQIENTL